MRSIKFLTVFIFLLNFTSFAQQKDSTKTYPVFWGFADIYFAYDFNKPTDHNRPGFIYSHNRHNEFALNNGIAGLRYTGKKIRGAFALHSGTYVRANYAAEPDLLRLIYEANAGFEITRNLWVDAGIFTSHIGAETAISIDNFTLTRSIMAEHTPYYESGAKLTWTPNSKWLFSGLVLNGWQNIAENNNNKALGSQIQFKPKSNILFNSSTFFGKEKAAFDSVTSMRFFHNFYAQIDIKKISVLAAFDIGFQDRRNESGANVWYNPNLIIRFKPTDKTAIAGRIEYYRDKNGVIINTGTANGFNTFSPSLNFDYWITENFAWRTEARLFNSKDNIFTKENKLKKEDIFLISSLAIKI